MKVISDKEVRVATLVGAVVLFAAGVEREVSEEIGLLAMQMGAKEVSGTAAEEEVVVTADEPEVVIEEAPEEEAAPEEVSAESAEPDPDLVAVMESLMSEGDPENFKADGTPKASAVNKAAGRTVSTLEREIAWQEALNT